MTKEHHGEAAADEEEGDADAAVPGVETQQLARDDHEPECERGQARDRGGVEVAIANLVQRRGVLVARERKPADQVHRNGEARGGQRGHYPKHTDDDDVDVERVGHPGRDTGDPLPLLAPLEAPRRPGRGGR
jgi:hypothetical protein